MAKVTLKPIGTLRFALGDSPEVQIEGGTTLSELLQRVAKEYDAGFWQALVDQSSGELRESVHIFVNKESSRQLQGLGTPLADGDVVTILRADIAGG